MKEEGCLDAGLEQLRPVARGIAVDVVARYLITGEDHQVGSLRPDERRWSEQKENVLEGEDDGGGVLQHGTHDPGRVGVLHGTPPHVLRRSKF
jgi:hypothetical protein